MYRRCCLSSHPVARLATPTAPRWISMGYVLRPLIRAFTSGSNNSVPPPLPRQHDVALAKQIRGSSAQHAIQAYQTALLKGRPSVFVYQALIAACRNSGTPHACLNAVSDAVRFGSMDLK